MAFVVSGAERDAVSLGGQEFVLKKPSVTKILALPGLSLSTINQKYNIALSEAPKRSLTLGFDFVYADGRYTVLYKYPQLAGEGTFTSTGVYKTFPYKASLESFKAGVSLNDWTKIIEVHSSRTNGEGKSYEELPVTGLKENKLFVKCQYVPSTNSLTVDTTAPSLATSYNQFTFNDSAMDFTFFGVLTLISEEV